VTPDTTVFEAVFHPLHEGQLPLAVILPDPRDVAVLALATSNDIRASVGLSVASDETFVADGAAVYHPWHEDGDWDVVRSESGWLDDCAVFIAKDAREIYGDRYVEFRNGIVDAVVGLGRATAS
jgi:hypothetical protein